MAILIEPEDQADEGITLNSDTLTNDLISDTLANDLISDPVPGQLASRGRQPTNYKEWLAHDLKRERVNTSAAMRQRVQIEIDRLKQQRESNLVIIENRDYDCPNADLYLKLREAFPGRETKEDLKKIPQLIDRYLNSQV